MHRMRLGGMDKQVKNIDKLTTVTACRDWSNCRSTLLVSCVTVSFSFLMYEQTHLVPFVTTVSVALSLPVDFCMDATFCLETPAKNEAPAVNKNK